MKSGGKKSGFTIIEVSLFLAISGILMMGIIATTAGTINRHRYDDSVQDFYSYLTGLYSSATNAQNTDEACSDDINNKCGRSETAIYGYIAIFGSESDSSTVRAYNLKGKADISPSNNNLIDALKEAKIDIALNSVDGEKQVDIASTYDPIWEATIQDTRTNPYNPYKGAVAIIRSPLDGTLYTSVYGSDAVQNLLSSKESTRHNALVNINLTDDIDFCIDSPDLSGQKRSNVRIHAGGRNSSAVEVIQRDLPESEGGNRCQ